MTNYKVFYVNHLQTACTVIWGEDGHCAICDPGCEFPEEREALETFIQKKGLIPDTILLTHGHPDHIASVNHFQKLYDIPVRMHPAEKSLLPIFKTFGAGIGIKIDIGFTTTDIAEGDVIPVGSSLRLRVLETPGHSAGGVCYYDADGGILLAGDVLFAGSIGRSDLLSGDYDKLIASILEKLIPLPSEVIVIPGHGPTTTIGAESATNPFLEPFNEPNQLNDL